MGNRTRSNLGALALGAMFLAGAVAAIQRGDGARIAVLVATGIVVGMLIVTAVIMAWTGLRGRGR